MIWLYLIPLLLLIGAILLVLGVAGLIVWGFRRLIGAWRARRNRRELENEFLLRVAMDDARRHRMIPEDLQ